MDTASINGHVNVLDYLLGLEYSFTPWGVSMAHFETLKYLDRIPYPPVVIYDYLKGLMKSAVKMGNFDSLGRLLGKGISVNVDKGIALRSACRANRLDVVKYLLKKGANPNISRGDPLIAAINTKNLDMVKILLKHGGKLENLNCWEMDLTSEMWRFLITKGLQIDPRSLPSKLIRACTIGELEIVKFLVEEIGADINHGDDEALRSCAKYGDLVVIKYLIENGANIRAKNDEVLLTASRYGHDDFVKFCLEQGCDPKSQKDFILADALGKPSTLKLLIDAGCPVNNYAIIRALQEAKRAEALFLLDHEEVSLAGDYRLRQIIRNAASKGDVELVRLLVNKGAELDGIFPTFESPQVNEYIKLKQAP